MTIRFGVSPIAWINDDMPELGGDTPLESVLADCQAIGFEGVELGGVFPRDPAVLKPLLDRYGLDLVGGWYSGNLLAHSAEDEIAALQPHLALLKAMGCTVFIHAETSNAIHGARDTALSATPRLDAEGWTLFGARLTKVADYIAAQGLKFAYHHHLGTVVERPQDLEAFLGATGPSVGLTVDTGHAALGGVDPVALIRAHPERVAHVHCKDVRREVFQSVIGQKGGSFLDGVLAGMFTVPGDGGLDYAAVMQALAEINYSGWIIVEAEQDPAIANPRQYGEMGLATLKKEAAATGLRAA
ncbi:myo-inosose-2 dehydratase [Caulobacter vibrioides]|uniref:IolE protein n=2 Tax=Caulobacter vibrioides TaxID=155892 RepID=Q9A8Q3_CAUVC|nr:myo-inosose-2 dehydratase [Caulobacter vibrioides]YP_002516731.1 myo-inositol catabolism protein IolE [Caulobacter vibrioides NA1000]AAK23281.1 iolE protein [Caulobacter vibrioides CB15]ACL94823.1 myo-inositol catabolism protein IolE [Caulobacter vibrioides NA1000]ATC28114.1 myo-inosose-2 dehydratase [Caulobacter vibrioides]QXZ53378.1 myo-inosose-2 dehydratase [Caulobacter vibrioides]